MGKVYKIRDLQVEKLKEKQILIAQNEAKIISESEIIHALIDCFLDKLTAKEIENVKKKKS